MVALARRHELHRQPHPGVELHLQLLRQHPGHPLRRHDGPGLRHLYLPGPGCGELRRADQPEPPCLCHSGRAGHEPDRRRGHEWHPSKSESPGAHLGNLRRVFLDRHEGGVRSCACDSGAATSAQRGGPEKPFADAGPVSLSQAVLESKVVKGVGG